MRLYKNCTMIYRILLSSLLLLVTMPILAQQKRALLIGIGSYPRESGWKSLSSENDIRYLQSVLLSKGFPASHLRVLLNERATLAGIQQAFEQLIAEAGEGDIVMIHYSGHGQQITDDNDDEADGYDEAWVPFDAGARFNPTGYTGTKHLRDDVIGEWIAALSRKVGPKGSILVNIDACHSGTATRGQELAITRGDPTPFRIPGKRKTPPAFTNAPASEMLTSDAVQGGNVVVYSASSPTQVNYETLDAGQQGVGSLTYAFAKSMSELPGDATYVMLFYRIKAKIQAWIPAQIPMMEGNAKQALFSGEFLKSTEQQYIDRWASDSTFTIKWGSLHDMAVGAELNIIDPGTKKIVATGTVLRSELTESLVATKTPLDKTKPWEIAIKSLPMAPYRLGVGYDKNSVPKNWIPTLDKVLQGFGFINKTAQPDCWIVYSKDSGMVVIDKQGGVLYWDETLKGPNISAEKVEALKPLMRDIGRATYLRTLPDGGPIAEQVIWEIITKDGRKASENELAFAGGDTFDILLRNNSSRPIYYAILNIMPDGKMEVLLPAAHEAPEDRSLQPKESLPIADNEIQKGTPGGREYLKILVSHTPFDIRPMLSKQAKKRSGNLLGLESTLIDIMQEEAGGAPKKRSVQANEITIITRSFQIK
jgi:metacaspase-1